MCMYRIWCFSPLVVNDKSIEYDDVCTDMRECTMEDEWQARVKAMLKAELKRKGVSYRELADKLNTMGENETDRNIANKISRGGFSAAFFVQCLAAIGCSAVRIEDA